MWANWGRPLFAQFCHARIHLVSGKSPKARRRQRERRRQQKALIRTQLRQARLILSAHYGSGRETELPNRQAVINALLTLSTLPWNKSENIRELTVLTGLRGVRPCIGKFVPHPDADVLGLHRFLSETVDRIAARDERMLAGQVGVAVMDRKVGRPAALLLGLSLATRNSRIGIRRELAARARYVSTETMRRWHEQELCALIADEIVSHEAELIRILPRFVVNGETLPIRVK